MEIIDARELIPIPEDLFSTISFRIIDFEEDRVFVFMVPLMQITSEYFDLSLCLASCKDQNITILVLYLEDTIIQTLENGNVTLTQEMLKMAIVFARYYVMIEIDHRCVSKLKNNIEETKLPLVFWITYSNLEESLYNGITSFTINRKINLPTYIIIHHSLDDFKVKMLKQLDSLPSHMEEHRELLLEKIEETYTQICSNIEEELKIEPYHPFLVSSTMNGKKLCDHLLFRNLNTHNPHQWIINTSIWHST